MIYHSVYKSPLMPVESTSYTIWEQLLYNSSRRCFFLHELCKRGKLVGQTVATSAGLTATTDTHCLPPPVDQHSPF